MRFCCTTIIPIQLVIATVVLLVSGFTHPTHGACAVLGFGGLTADATYECVIITGKFFTNGHVLTVTGSGGLICTGDLYVNGGGVVLTGGGTHIVSGAALLHAGSFLRIQERSSTITGGGALIGADNSAVIDIWPNVTLTNDIVIEGGMAISGSGTLRNWGIVSASSGDTISLGPATGLADAAGSVWEAAGGTLRFTNTHTGNCALHGDIALYDDGTLDLDASIAILAPGASVATFTWEGGALDIATGAQFTFEDFAGGCDEPTSPVPGPYVQVCS